MQDQVGYAQTKRAAGNPLSADGPQMSSPSPQSRGHPNVEHDAPKSKSGAACKIGNLLLTRSFVRFGVLGLLLLGVPAQVLEIALGDIANGFGNAHAVNRLRRFLARLLDLACNFRRFLRPLQIEAFLEPLDAQLAFGHIGTGAGVDLSRGAFLGLRPAPGGLNGVVTARLILVAVHTLVATLASSAQLLARIAQSVELFL